MAKAEARHGKSIWLLVAIVIFFVVDGVAATAIAGGVIQPDNKRRRLVKPLEKPAATVKTVKSEYGDIIDCVDIYKQPAFDHPALKKHTIQMKPSDHTEEEMARASARNASRAQLWRVNGGSCPQGTIPILRPSKDKSLNEVPCSTAAPVPESVALTKRGTFYGASADLNVWDNLHVDAQDESACTVYVGRQSKFGTNFISAGWQASNPLYGDRKSRFTIYWTDRRSKNWWLKLGNTPVGYWPISIFKDLWTANTVTWGARVSLSYACDGGADHHHSTTEMGNGHFPTEGFRKSAYVAGALYTGSDNEDHGPYDSYLVADNQYCYSYKDYGMGCFDRFGDTFFYGGNGNAEGCFR
ncbi:hypothetical protein ACLOJK_029689 [Asimina triloba]